MKTGVQESEAKPTRSVQTEDSAGAPLALRLVTLVCLCFTIGTATWAAWDQGVTYDEPFHLRWADRLLEEGNDQRDEFRFDSKTPALIPAVVLQRVLKRQGAESETSLRFASRLPSLVWLIAVLMLVARLAATPNPATCWLGLLLAALDPNLAAHASIATTDLAYAGVVLALAWALSAAQPSRTQPVLVGLVLGTAFAIKFSAVLLLPVAGIALAWSSRTLRGRVLRAITATVTACLTMDALYLFVGVGRPLGQIPLQTPALKAAASIAPWLPSPIPASVLTGLDASLAHNDPSYWASYIFGEEHRGGVWYYFAANWLLKTPLALIVAVLVGLWLIRPAWRNRATAVMGSLFLVHLLYFSFFFPTQIGLRFALPCTALACAMAARGLGRVRIPWLVALASLCLAERLPYWGDPIAFTNTLVWPKSRAYWYTADSNLDYGQNRTRLERYARESGLALVLDQATVTPGNYVVGANDLVIFDTGRFNRWLVERRIPAVNLGFTYFAFAITDERFEDYLNSARLVAGLDVPDPLCAPPLPHYPPGAQIDFEQRDNPENGRLWIVCVTSRKGADIGFRLTEGRAYFGRVTPQGVCEGDLLQSGQQAWFRVPSALNARLCIREIPLRRSHIPYAALGYLTVRGQGADLEVRSASPDLLK